MDSPHQVIAPDEARDTMGCDDNQQDVASADAAKSNALSTEIFDCESLTKPLVDVATAFQSLTELTKDMDMKGEDIENKVEK